MKKQLIMALLLALHLTFIFGCKDKTVPTEEGFTSFLADSTMRIKITATNNPVYYEFGFKFQILKEGNVVKVGTRLPNVGSYRVCIWDFATKSVLLEKNVTQSQPNKQAWTNVSNLLLRADKEYFISVIANNWNDAYPKTGANILYPIIKGNVKVLGFAYASQPSSIAPPKLPNMTDNNSSISGFVDFGFISK